MIPMFLPIGRQEGADSDERSGGLFRTLISSRRGAGLN
jgi:hypothetical protein